MKAVFIGKRTYLGMIFIGKRTSYWLKLYLCSQKHTKYYYDNKRNGEVDYLIDDVDNLSNIPIEVKSGKDYTVHSALDKFLSNDEYHIKRAYVLSNEQKVFTENGITYMPIYYIMFFQHVSNVVEQFLD